MKNVTGIQNSIIEDTNDQARSASSKNLSNNNPVKIKLPIVTRTIKAVLGNCCGIASSLSSLLKNLPPLNVTFEKFLTTRGTPTITAGLARATIILRDLAFSGISETTKETIVVPRTSPRASIKFQKLSLFILDSKNPFAALSRPHGAGLTLAGAVFSSWLFSFVKSCIRPFFIDYWFKTYTSIVPGFLFARKGIIAAVLGACLNFGREVAFASADVSSPISQLKQFIQSVEKQNNIPSGLLTSIAKIESGFRPNAINIAGRPVFARNKVEAARLIRESLASGKSNIDVGVMQINYPLA